MFEENHFFMVLKFIMNIYSPLFCIVFFVILCNFSHTQKQKHKRLSGIHDEIYLPSLINFELKGKSMAWIPVRLTGRDIQSANNQLKKNNLRKPRFVEEGSWNGTCSPKKIYNAQEDTADPNSGTGEDSGSLESAEPIDDFEIDTKSPEVTELTMTECVETTSVRTTTVVDASTKTTQSLLSATEGPLTDDTMVDIITVILGTGTCFIKEHRHSSNIPTEGVTTEPRSSTVEHTLKITNPQKMEGKDEYWEEDKEVTTGKNASRKETVHDLFSSFTTRLAHIETPPRPRRPLDLNFPTCSGNEDSLEIEPPVFRTHPTHQPAGNRSKKKDKCKLKLRKSSHHPTHQNVTAIYTTVAKSNKNKSTATTLAIPEKKHEGPDGKDAKVLVRIPASLSELPVVVLRDPKTKILSLSLVRDEQKTVKPTSYSNQHKSFYYPHQPFYYQQMLPPPFPYNNIYFPNYPPVNKMYPYWYMYGPNVMNNRETFMIPNKQKHRDYINNIRLIRDTYYEEEDEERNITKSNLGYH